jgi:hypothetical protein
MNLLHLGVCEGLILPARETLLGLGDFIGHTKAFLDKARRKIPSFC